MELSASIVYIYILQLKKVIVLAESSFLSFVFKPFNVLCKSPGISQVDAASFSSVYPFILKIIYILLK